MRCVFNKHLCKSQDTEGTLHRQVFVNKKPRLPGKLKQSEVLPRHFMTSLDGKQCHNLIFQCTPNPEILNRRMLYNFPHSFGH